MIAAIVLILVCIFANLFLLWNFPKAPPLLRTTQYDTCIILGSPAKEDGTISRMQKTRMDKAIKLYQQHLTATLLVSGGGVRNQHIEADVMAAYAVHKGVNQADIIVENKAQNTYDNLRYAKILCEQRDFHQILVVTSRFHVRRANFFVHKFFTSYAMCGSEEHEKIRHYLSEYVRMWNTLRIEYIMKWNSR